MIDAMIQKKINDLPDNIRRAIERFDWASEILHISQNHQIQIDDIEVFRRETLLVIVGLTPAADFQKNLMKNMGVSRSLAEELVADANAHIFAPLQKMAFSRQNTEPAELEEEIIHHDDLTDAMSEHGIELVDEFEPEAEKPKNELQALADDIFNTSEPETKETKVSEPKAETSEPETTVEKPLSYNEPIDESDLQGIKKHRIDTTILNQVQPEHILSGVEHKKIENTLNQSLDKKLFTQTHISQNETFDLSPTENEQAVQDGEFLKRIGAIE